MNFRKLLLHLNELKRKKIILNYAIGGGIAAYRYTTLPTKDVDVFIVMGKYPKELILLTPIYDYFRKLGYRWKGQWLIIEGFPTEFLPVIDSLEKEAVAKAMVVIYQKVRTRFIRPEYLIALSLRTGRIKDRFRATMIVEQAKLNRVLLNDILARYRLQAELEKLL